MAIATELPLAGEAPQGQSSYRFDTIGDRKSVFAASERMRSPDSRTRTRHGEEVSTPEQDRAITPELQENYREFATSELHQMLDNWDMDRAGLEQRLQHPDYHPYKLLFERFTEVKAGSLGIDGIPMRHIKKKELEDYLKTDAGFADMYELRKIRLEEVALNSGAFLDVNLNQVPPRAINDIDTETVHGKWAYDLFIRRFGGWMGEPHEEHGRRIVNPRGGSTWDRFVFWDRTRGPRTKVGSAVRGAAFIAAFGTAGLAAGPFGALAVGAIPPAARGIYEAFRRGEKIDINKTREALRIAQTDDPIKREFARNMWNIDAANLAINENGQVEIREGIRSNAELASPTMYFKAVEDFLKGESEVIRLTEEKMSQRPELLNGGMDVQGFGRGNEQFSSKDIKLDTQVNRQVKRELVDGRGNRCQVFFRNAAGVVEWVDNTPDFYTANAAALNALVPPVTGPFNRNQVNQIEFFRLRRTVRRRLLTERMHRNIRNAVELGRDHKKDLGDLIAERKGAHGPQSETTKRRKEERDAEQKLLTSEEKKLETTAKEITDYEEYLKTQREALQKNEEIRRREESNVEIITPPGVAAPADAEEALTRLLTEDSPLQVRLRGSREVISSLVAEHNWIEAAIQRDVRDWRATSIDASLTSALTAATTATTAEAQDAASKLITSLENRVVAYEQNLRERRYKAELTRYEKRETQVAEILEKLQKAREENGEVTVDLTDRYEDHRKLVEKTARDMPQARRDIEGWGVAPSVTAAPNAPDLSINALATTNIDILLQRINEAYTRARAAASPVNGIGWPATENQNEKNRQRLLYAVAEARAIQAEPRIHTPSPELTRATSATFGLTQLDLLALTNDELIQRMTDMLTSGRVPAGTPLIQPADLDVGRTEVRDNLSARQRALVDVRDSLVNRGMEVSQEIQRLETEGLPQDELDTYERAVSQYDAAGETIKNMTHEQLVASLSTDIIDPSPAALTAGAVLSPRAREFLPAERENDRTIASVTMDRWLFDPMDISQERVRFGGQVGRDAAVRRNSSIFTDNIKYNLLRQHFNLAIPPPPGAPRGTPPTYPADFNAAINLIRTGVINGAIRQRHIAEFIQQTVIFGYIAPRVPAL